MPRKTLLFANHLLSPEMYAQCVLKTCSSLIWLSPSVRVFFSVLSLCLVYVDSQERRNTLVNHCFLYNWGPVTCHYDNINIYSFCPSSPLQMDKSIWPLVAYCQFARASSCLCSLEQEKKPCSPLLCRVGSLLTGGVKPLLPTGVGNSHLVTPQVPCRSVVDNFPYEAVEKKSMTFVFLYVYPQTSCCVIYRIFLATQKSSKPMKRQWRIRSSIFKKWWKQKYRVEH